MLHRLLLLLTLLPLAVHADEPRVPLIAVLELKVQNKAIDLDLAVTLGNLVRTRVVGRMGGAVKLVSKEKVMEILQRGNKSAAQCTGDCEIQTAREIGVDYAVTGSVSPLGQKSVLVLEIKRMRDGVTVAAAEVKAPGAALDEKLNDAVDTLCAAFQKALAAVPAKPEGGATMQFGQGLTRVDVPEVKMTAGGNAALSEIDVEVEQLRDAAEELQGAATATAAQKRDAWCALAARKGAYAHDAQTACDGWKRYIAARDAAQAALTADTTKLEAVMRLKHFTVEQKKSLVAGYLQAYGAFADHAGVQAARSWQNELAAGRVPIVVPAGMVRLVAGSFDMGSNNGEESEKPVHRVTLTKDFALDRTEVTLAAYTLCQKAGVCVAYTSGYWSGKEQDDVGCNWDSRGREDHPMNCVDWSQAAAYCGWAGKRLPTEAEWEFAARSGGRAQAWPWGVQAADCTRAVMNDGKPACGREQTSPVCSKPAGNSAQGLCDLVGNVWEWAADGDMTYRAGDATDPVLSNSEGKHVLRGGSWANAATFERASTRMAMSATDRSLYIGFRCAKTL